MIDALNPMSEAPTDSRSIAFWKDSGNATLCRRFGNGTVWTPDGNAVSNLKGFLPLPADASSTNVAKTAGEWLQCCTVEDRAKVAQWLLKDDDVTAAWVDLILESLALAPEQHYEIFT